MASLQALREATVKSAPIKFYEGDDVVDLIKTATHAQFGDSPKFDLSASTNFYNEGAQQLLRAVVFSWLHEKSSIVDYKNECLENGIADFKFLVKAELTAWLNGSSDTCSFIKDESQQTNGTAAPTEESKKRKLEDPQMERIANIERDFVDHNAALRGSKNIEFGYLISDAKRFISQLKGSKSKSSKTTGPTGTKKQPIIIVSPATTALLSLTNVKQFLEDGKFVEPSATSNTKPADGIVTLHHSSERLISAGHHFMVVDNVEVFTKPEYWDRVVAIFTTGQAWQFAKYKYPKPEELFQRYAGYYVSYTGDVVPRQIKEWNVSEIQVDRGDKRFRDKMIVRDFWADIERILVSKGYGRTD